MESAAQAATESGMVVFAASGDNDITVGNNGAYQALTGPDPCSEIGTPIGTKLAALLA